MSEILSNLIIELRRDLWSKANRLVNKIAPPWKDPKYPIYRMGCADPVNMVRPGQTVGYTCFSGADIKVTIDGKSAGTVQSLSVGKPRQNLDDDEPGLGGEMALILFDNMDHRKLLGKQCRVTAAAANMYGHVCVVYDADVKFDEHEKFTMSIDDIVMEITIGYTLIKRYPQEKEDETD